MASFRPALIIVDLQEDFLPPNGSLAVPNGREVIPIINELTKLPWTKIIATKDWHPKDHCSFASNHPGAKPFDNLEFDNPEDPEISSAQTVWPDHCVQESFGSQFPPEFTTKDAEGKDIVNDLVLKGYLQDREYYSAFNDVWRLHKTELEDILRKAEISDVYVVGLALDYCVYNTAADAKRLGWNTSIIRQGTKPVYPDTWGKMEIILKDRAIELIELDGPEVNLVRNIAN